MKKVRIDPGVCGFVTTVQAEFDPEEDTVTLQVETECQAVQQMMARVGDTFPAYALCLTQPGTGILYESAAQTFPVHAACPVLAGILKCAEAESGLALPRNASITFED